MTIGIIRALDRSEKQRRLRTTFRGRVVSTFAGLRGGVSLAVALSVPAGAVARNFVIFVVGGVVILSMVVQGLLLPAVIRWAKIPSDASEEEEIHFAMNTISSEGYDALDDIAAQVGASQVKPNGSNSERSYSQCILDKSGFGFVGGAARGALNRLIQKKMWKQAAIKIISIVGRSALKGGVVGLVAALIAAAGWCALPWVN